MLRKPHMAGGGALRAAAKAIERTKPARTEMDEVTRLKRMIQNARSYERAMAEANKPYDATRAAMLERALNDGVFAADKNFPERSVNLLKLADPAAPSSVARGALSFRDPGYYAGAGGIPEDAVYIDDLGALRTKGVPVGQALLHRLQDEVNGLPLVLESIDDPRTLQWYAERGFRPLPKNEVGKNPFGSRLPALILPRGVQLKAAGGAIRKFAGGGALKTLGKLGRGWWANKSNRVIREMTEEALGPHGDHDGWIAIAKNAKSLGVDPKEAKAMQRGTYGFRLSKKMTDDWVKQGGSPSDVYRGRAAYYPMFGDSYAPADKLFERLYGLSPVEAASGSLLGNGSSLDNLMRIRAWPDFKNKRSDIVGTVSADSATGVTPKDLQWVWENIGNDLPVTDATRFTAQDVHGDQFNEMLLREALLKKHKFADGGVVKSRKQVSADMREGALSGLRRFFSAIPQAVRDWPQQTWDMVRLPADLVLGSPDENRIAREYAPDELKPLPNDTARNPHRPGSPESKAYETMAWANPLQAAVFAPAQTARMVASPVGQATLGGLAALTLPGVNMPSAFAAGNVIKPVGGQWLGTGEGGKLPLMLDRLRRSPGILSGDILAEMHDDPQIWNRVLAEKGHRDLYAWTKKNLPDVWDKMIGPEGVALNRWIDGPLRKYVLNRMASPDDEIRKLAEVGPIHRNFEEGFGHLVTEKEKRNIARMRSAAGFPKEGFARSPLAEKWELLTDRTIDSTPNEMFGHPRSNIRGVREPWMDKLPPDEPIYRPTDDMNEFVLGFDHLVDELHNALRADSDLPANLRLRPENLNKLSMEQAVKRVAEINAWREAQKVTANQELANRAALVREYAENNPKGLRWVELKAPSVKGKKVQVEKEYADVVFDIPQDAQDKIAGEAYAKAQKKVGKKFGDETDEFREAFNEFQLELSNDWVKKNPQVETITEAEKALRDQLKYEGETMGHCVGGYCDDVLEGRSRIFSLRDAKGEPHVTVEVGKRSSKTVDPDDEQATEWILQKAKELAGEGDEMEKWEEATELFLKEKPLSVDVPYIVQIKGKGNKKPIDEYLPFVQDFVRNSPLGSAWSDVGDLQNTNLRRTIDAFNSNELKMIQDAGIEVPQWATPDEINEIGKKVWPNKWGKFAEGGSVQAQPWQHLVAAPTQGWDALLEATV